MIYVEIENCINVSSYGMICVHCNCCGRFGKETNKSDLKAFWLSKLDEEKNFERWSAILNIRKQQEVIQKQNIKYIQKKLAELES